MSDLYPNSLRPGGPSPSPSPKPDSQIQSHSDDMQRSQQYTAYGGNQEPQLPQSTQQLQPGQNESRYQSQYYGQPGQYNVETSGGGGSSNAFGESSGRRSRSSTIGQSYPIVIDQAPPSMPTAQPLFAQHSGQPGAPQGGSRPTSQQGRSQPMNPSALQSGFQPAGAGTRPGTASGPGGQGSNQGKSPFTTPITSPPRSRPSQILLVNPTSSSALTNTMLSSLRPILPPQLEVVGYTAHYPAPTATETTVDQALSTELVLRDLAKYATNNGETVQNFDALLVASFTNHPLIYALRESYDVPVIGLMEGSLYVSRMLGARFGIIASTNRHKIQTDDAVHMSGLEHYYAGCEAVHMSPIEILASASANSSGALPEEATKRLAHAARVLVGKGADTLIMGSEAMSNIEVIRAAKDAIREEDGRRTVNVVDCVEAGVMCLNALVGMGVPTSKKGVYRGEREGRRARGQNWL